MSAARPAPASAARGLAYIGSRLLPVSFTGRPEVRRARLRQILTSSSA